MAKGREAAAYQREAKTDVGAIDMPIERCYMPDPDRQVKALLAILTATSTHAPGLIEGVSLVEKRDDAECLKEQAA